MQASAEPFRFRRKPAINNHQDIAVKQNLALPHPQKTKNLKFQKKIFEINVCLSSPQKEKADQSLAYSISLTPITSSQKKNVQQNKMQEAIRYLYGTESDNNKLEEINKKDENQEESILLEYEQLLLNNEQPKISFTPLTNCTNEGQSQKNIILPLQISCSKFQLNSNQYKLSFVFLNEFVVKILYSPSKGGQNYEALDSNSDIRLAARMRQFFSKSPLMLFQFIITTLQSWNDQTLKVFLISNGVKFSSEQFTKLKEKLQQLSSSKDIFQVAQELFLSSSQQQEAVLNIQNLKLGPKYQLRQNSFLSFFQTLMKNNEAQNLNSSVLIIQDFMRKAI